MKPSRRIAIATAVLAVLLALAAGVAQWRQWLLAGERPGAPALAAHFVGTQACVACHADQVRQWSGSHHQLAMQPALPGAVLAPFAGERAADGTAFTRRGERFFAGAHEITHTLGVYPLQQYVVSMPDGRLQAYGTAWDARPAQDGGQRWFELQDGRHWTGRQANVNFMCADCHTTGFRKQYDAGQDRYRSTWIAQGVSCESCHGPGSSHVAWADGGLLRRLQDERKGLGLAAARRDVELCARCHTHRSQIDDTPFHGQPLLDTHVPSLLEEGLFHPDGQARAEVFNAASFAQSKMHAQGVTCNSCHNPHTLKLRAPGNQACLQCHAAQRFDTSAHHFHGLGSDGARCVNCHMPPATYMGVDRRHDHAIRIPRPDLAQEQGTPDACTACHTGKSAAWAAATTARWYPGLAARPAPALASAQMAAAREAPDALLLLLALTADPAQPAIARATALSQLPRHPGAGVVQRLCEATREADPLLRKTAVDALADATGSAAERAACLRPLLGDPVKAVRIAAARWLAGAPTGAWSAAERAQLARGTDEYIAVQHYNADRPETRNNLAMLYADQGRLDLAEQTLRAALEFAPDFAATSLNLADLRRAQGRDAEALALLRQAAQRHADNSTVYYALGLAELRNGQRAAARDALQTAARLAPGNRQYDTALRALAQQGNQ